MNTGILLLGVCGGLLVGGGIALQSRAARRRAERLARNGVERAGTITSSTATGRFAAWRRLTVTVDGGDRFIQTVTAIEASTTGLREGATVTALLDPDEPGRGVIGRPATPPPRTRVAVAAGLFIAGLGVLAALVS